MGYDADYSMTRASDTSLSMFTFLRLLLLTVLLFCPGCDRDESPPDLSGCTRIEVRYPRSTLEYFFPSSDLQESVLSRDEEKYIQSIEFFTIKDPERIKAFAHDVSLGSYNGRSWFIRVFDDATPVVVDCYCDNKHMASLMVCNNLIITKNKRIFKYPKGLPDLKTIEPEEMQPFKLRFQCALNMQTIYTSGPLYRREVSSYPEPTDWCDAVMRDRTNTSYVSEERMRGHLKCPTAGEGKCHYAMNPHCEPNSPPDTVLLFETKTGWNQHGGPELFTFDHHDPKGGCVLLNDGTVKFVRTKEELQELRWK
jgi:hypothetical protein